MLTNNLFKYRKKYFANFKLIKEKIYIYIYIYKSKYKFTMFSSMSKPIQR